MKKTLKKSVLKAARKGKAPNEKVLEDTNVGEGYQKIPMLAETKVPEPTSRDKLDTFRGNMLMAWVRKLMKTP